MIPGLSEVEAGGHAVRLQLFSNFSLGYMMIHYLKKRKKKGEEGEKEGRKEFRYSFGTAVCVWEAQGKSLAKGRGVGVQDPIELEVRGYSCSSSTPNSLGIGRTFVYGHKDHESSHFGSVNVSFPLKVKVQVAPFSRCWL